MRRLSNLLPQIEPCDTLTEEIINFLTGEGFAQYDTKNYARCLSVNKIFIMIKVSSEHIILYRKFPHKDIELITSISIKKNDFYESYENILIEKEKSILIYY